MQMKLVVGFIALLVISAMLSMIALLIFGRPSLAEGKLRCEGAGAVIIKVDGTDYAVNTLAGPNYPPIQSIWNETTAPNFDLDRLIVRGLTLCNWRKAAVGD